MASRTKERRRTDRRLTEQRNAASKNLDRMTAVEIVRLMNREDRKVAVAVGREIPAIARAVDVIVRRMRNGGRLIYVGAGSSGRMAVLDAAECPPTFGTSPKLVQALIAGGRPAVTGAVEGAEDSRENGERDLRAKKLTRRDVVVGITASGTDLSASEHALRQSGHNLRAALVMLKLGVDARAATTQLAKSKGDLREALGE